MTPGTAIISPCGRYRYRLTRQLKDCKESGAVLFVMLNPSTATATENDSTIRRCITFANSWGYAEMWVGNLYALRATNPAELRKDYSAAVGPENDAWLRKLLREADAVVCAWGDNAQSDRVARFVELAGDRQLYCLDTNKSGQPKHPLYIKGGTERKRWPE
jgi:hypothetical protein